MRVLVGVLALVAAAPFALSADPARAGTLDQQQTSNSGGGYNIIGTFSAAQTFTAGITGALDRVDLHLHQAGAVNAQLTVEIRNAPGGLVGDSVLASGGIGPGVGASPGALLPVTFGSPAQVVAGTRYAIVAYTTAPGGPGVYYNWGFSPGDPYAGGQGFQGSSPHNGASFTVQAGHDLAFRTYVAPPAAVPPAAGTTGRRAAALKKCKKKSSKQKRRKCRRQARKLPV